jgi:hypothetical protein
MGPRQGSFPFSVDLDGLIVGYIRSDGRHVVVLGISGVDDCTTYIRSSEGKILLKTRNDGTSTRPRRAVVSTGLEYQKTVDAAFYRTREIIRSSTLGPSDFAEPAPVPSWYETW